MDDGVHASKSETPVHSSVASTKRSAGASQDNGIEMEWGEKAARGNEKREMILFNVLCVYSSIVYVVRRKYRLFLICLSFI